MIKLTNDKLQRAIERAKQLHPRVLWVGERSYVVESARNGRRYFVQFTKSQAGDKFGACSCEAGQNGQACYHLAGALGAHLGIMRMRQRATAH